MRAFAAVIVGLVATLPAGCGAPPEAEVAASAEAQAAAPPTLVETARFDAALAEAGPAVERLGAEQEALAARAAALRARAAALDAEGGDGDGAIVPNSR